MATTKDKLHELRRKKDALKAEFLAIAHKEEGEQTEEDVDRLTAIENDLGAVEKRVTTLEKALDMEAEEAGGGEPESGADEQRSVVLSDMSGVRLTPAEAKRFFPDQPGYKAARYIVGLLKAKTIGYAAAAQFAQNRFGDNDVAKALNTAGVSTGGAVIPQAFLPDLIELLRARVVVRKLGPMIVPMPMGNMTIPRLAAGATAGYQGELDDIPVSQQTFDDLQLNAKKLTALVPVSNDLIRRAPIGIEEIVRNDLIEVLARREDIAFLRGDGSGGSPIGLLNQCAASNKLVAAAFTAQDNLTVLTAVIGVLNGMMLALENNMSRMIKPAWIFAPQIKWFLMGLRDQVGNFQFKSEIETGKLLGLPFEVTQQLPTNLTNGQATGNVTEIYLVDFADVVLGETYNVSVDASDVASYKDQGGNLVSAYQRDQSLFRVIEEHDLALRHQASVIIAQVPAWVPAGYAGQNAGVSYFVQALSGDSSAAPSTFGIAPPTGSSNPANVAANVPGGTQPGRP